MIRLLAVFSLIALSGCSRDPQQQFHQIDQSLRSWRATVTLAALNWSDDAITTTYFHQILSAATRQLNQQEDDLAKTPADDSLHKSAQQTIADLRQRISTLNDLA